MAALHGAPPESIVRQRPAAQPSGTHAGHDDGVGGVDPCPVLPRSDSLAAVAENTPHGGQSGRAGSGADSNADGLKSPEPWRVPIDHSRRKSRNGTRAADDRQPDRRSEGAKGADASDE